MANPMIIFTERLKSTIARPDNQSAFKTIELISQYFDDRISENEAELAVERMFATETTPSVLGFVKLVLPQCKTFKEVIIQVFELMLKVIELHPVIVKKYVKSIVEMCLTYISPNKNPAHLRKKAAEIVYKLLTQELIDDINKEFVENFIRLLRKNENAPISSIVLRKLFEIMGVLLKKHANCMIDAERNEIKLMLLRPVEDLCKRKENVCDEMVDLTVVTGSLNGLNYLLGHFDDRTEGEIEFLDRIYICAKILAVPVEGASKNEVHRSALKLLSNNSKLFSAKMLEDFYHWHNTLINKWLKKPITMQWDDRQMAIEFLYSFYRTIAMALMQSTFDKDGEKLMYMKNHFEKILETKEDCQAFETRLAIIGIGLLAAPCSKSPNSRHSKDILRLVMQRIENAANEITDKREQMENICDYVESLSKLIEYSEELSGIEMITIQNIIIAVIKNFHLFSKGQHRTIIDKLIRTFRNLSRLGDTMCDDILDTCIYHGIIWTCSHKLKIDEATMDWTIYPDWKQHITIDNYLPFWNGFFVDVNEDMDLEEIMIQKKIYDYWMKTLLKIIEKLDLSTVKRIRRTDRGDEDDILFCNPEYNLVAKQPKDFHIFFNLVDLYRATFKAQSFNIHLNNFIKWINIFMETMISKSLEYPLISGFVKLMQTSLSIANRLNYFNNELFEENYQIYDRVCYYLDVIIRRVQECSGELQIGFLILVLTTPTSMLQRFVNNLVSILKTALDVGKSDQCFFIAKMALKVTKRYISTMAPDSIEQKEFLQAILPEFCPYLQGFQNDNAYTIGTSKKNVKEITVHTTGTFIQVNESDLLKFQKNILLVLSTLNPEYCQCLLRYDENVNLVQSTNTMISITLHGPDHLEPKIVLNGLIVRIREIILTTTDRQKRITACEFIQAVILFCLGSNRNYGPLWMELCELMLQLGCDSDTSIRQIFEPLAMQTMHFITNPIQVNQIGGAENVFNAIMHSIAHPSSLAIRDLSARCLREFFTWIIKQRIPQQMINKAIGIDKLVERLTLMNGDTMQSNRFGAALAFNNIYHVIREEESIIDKYWLSLFHSFCINFQFSEKHLEEHFSYQTNLDQVTSSLDHVMRVLKERKDIFNAMNKERERPVPFKEPQLKYAVLWLLEQCKSAQNKYRAKVMDMFLQLSSCVEGFNSTATFIRDKFTSENVIDLCENGIRDNPFDEKPLDFFKMNLWLMGFNTSLDLYVWAIENNILANIETEISNTNIFVAIRNFLEQIMDSEFPKRFIVPQTNVTINITQMKKLNKLQSEVMLRMFKFINIMIPTNCVPEIFWKCQKINKIVSQTIFNRQFPECNTKDPLFVSQSLGCVEQFIVNINRNGRLDGETKKSFNYEIAKECLKHYETLINEIKQLLLGGAVSSVHLNHVKGIDTVSRLMRNKKIEFMPNFRNSFDILTKNGIYEIFDGLKEATNNGNRALNPSPDALRLATHLLRISFERDDICNNVIDLLLNSTKLQLRSSKTVSHGKHFLRLFRQTIYDFLIKTMNRTIGRLIESMTAINLLYIIRIFIEFLEHVYTYHSKNVNRLNELTNLLLSEWANILKKSTENPNDIVIVNLIDLMGQIAMICPFELCDIATKAPAFEQWLLHIISDNDKFSIELKSKAIFLLPCLIGSNTQNTATIYNALRSFRSKYFPLESREFRIGSIDRTAFENMFQTLLTAMCASKSPILLQFLIISSAADEKHIMGSKIQSHLKRFILSLDPDTQLRCLNEVFESFQNIQYNPSVRLSILRRYLIPLIRNSHLDKIIEFYRLHIDDINQCIRMKFEMKDYVLHQSLNTRIGGYELLNLMFGVIPYDHFEKIDDPINVALRDHRKNIAKADEKAGTVFTRSAFAVRRELFTSDNALHMEWFRQYQCAAYNMLCTILCNSNKTLQYYEKLIFSPEKPWHLFINITKNDLYTDQSIEVDEKPKLKARLINIRQLKQSNTNPTFRKYIESQTIFESSLSQDVTKIDLSYSTVRATNDNSDQFTGGANSKMCRLEKNSINDHEIMATLCSLIEYIFENGITPFNENGPPRSVAPEWVKCIYNTIDNVKMHRNIKIFWMTVIDNCRHWFRHYAPAIVKSILKFLVDYSRGGVGSLATFMAVNLLEWEYPLDGDDERLLAGEFLKILMENAWHQNKAVFRHNLELIRYLMEKWGNKVQLPRQLLYDLMQHNNDDMDTKRNICGIELSGILLANGLMPWTDANRIDFLRNMDTCLPNPSVYQKASQVIGMALNELLGNGDGNDAIEQEISEIVVRLKKRLETLYSNDAKTKFLHIIYGIHKYYEPIVDDFLTRIASAVSKTTGGVKNFYLEMFLSRINCYDSNIFKELITINIEDLLQTKEYQLIALHIINKTLPKMSVNEIKQISSRLESFKGSKRAECRDLMYEIFIYIRQNVKDDMLKKMATNILLGGLNDADEQIQKNLFDYWCKSEQLPIPLNDRILYIFKHLYDHESRDHFLKYCVQFLLEQAINSPKSTDPIKSYDENWFDETKYVEYDIDVNSKSQQNTFRVPLFTETQQKLIESFDFDPMKHYLRATQNSLAFDATIDPGTLFQSSQSFSLDTHSSLLVNVAPQMLDRRSTKTYHQNEPTVNSAAADLSFNYLREHVLRVKNAAKPPATTNVINRMEYKKIKRNDQTDNKRSKVVLYRRYRFSDFPDFYIGTRAFLMPLQALIKNDAILARHTFVSIFNAVHSRLKFIERSDEFNLDEFSNAIQTILNDTGHCESMLFSALTDLTYTNALPLNIDPNVAIRISSTNDMLIDGILLLEHQLIAQTQIDAEDKKRHWLKLANMYYGLSEFDIVASIFSERISSGKGLSAPTAAESNSNYSLALKLYTKVIAQENHNQQQEIDFAYESAFKCYEMMGRWEDMETMVENQIVTTEDLWTDPWNNQHLLPHYVRSKLRMSLAGSASAHQFVRQMEEWLRNTKRSQTVKHDFTEQLMMMYIANEDYKLAKVCSDQYLESFLADWSKMNILSEKVRVQRLFKVRTVAEVQGYADMLSNTAKNHNIKHLPQQWNKTKMNKTDPTQIWESLVGYRVFVAETEMRCHPNVPLDIKNPLIETVCDLYTKLNELALQQNNIDLANTTLGRWQKFIENNSNGQNLTVTKIETALDLSKAKIKYLKSLRNTNTVTNILEHWSKLNGFQAEHVEIIAANPDLEIKIITQIGEFAEKLYEFLAHTPLPSHLERQIIKLVPTQQSLDLVSRIYEYPKECFKQILRLNEKYLKADHCEDNSEEAIEIGESYSRLAMFYLQHLAIAKIDRQTETERLIVESILRAMRYSSKKAQIQFPRLFELKNIEQPDIVALFNQEIENIPLWLIIDWIPQIVSRFDFNNANFLDNLLIKLAKQYPQALTYTFQLSFEEFRKQSEHIFFRNEVQLIRNNIENPLISKFINAINYLSFPEIVIKNCMQKILMKKNLTQPKKMLNDLKECYENVFGSRERSNLPIDILNIKDKLAALKDADKLSDVELNIIREIYKEMKSRTTTESSICNIEIFCQWLKDFHWDGGADYIELPGQYNSNIKPNMDQRLKIIKFHRKVMSMQSLRKPIKLDILCSNGKSYSFLAKCGEDLRQDERIQQLQSMMLHHLQNDKNCNQQKLSLRTYKVIPMNGQCGLLSWIENTQPLMHLIDQPELNKLQRMNGNDFLNFIGRNQGGIDPNLAIVRKPRQEIVAVYERMRNRVNIDFFRKTLYRISKTPECYFVLRNNFIKSLAVMCVSHWILGIGDRHLDNFLMDKSNGQLIGIDFNMAFGAATIGLHIPELMPFRLTPQLVAVMKPFGPNGLFDKCMSHTLRVLRAERRTMVICMEIFVREPTIDWLELLELNHSNIVQCNHTPKNQEDRHKLLQQRIDSVDKKLAGRNPIRLIEDNVKLNAYVKSEPTIIEGYSKLLNKCKDEKNYPDENLSVEQQIDCLIDIATDPGILGVAYKGAQTWL